LITTRSPSIIMDVQTSSSAIDGATASFVPGVQLGRYQLLRRLAIGGMAEVYLARATGIEGFEKLVVLKRILPQLAGSPDFVAMFLDEARLAARLQHPNIVQVFDVGASVDDYYIAMEYVDGKDVRAILSAAQRAAGPPPLGVALSIVQAVCRALQFAHDCTDDDGAPLGVVHRDVSPANVIVTYDGSTKLLDFGVAKAASQSRETEGGTLKGKIGYMSPEQCNGDSIDRRSDVFALGILLFELTTGTKLFREDSELKMLMRIVSEDAPCPSQRRADYPTELAFIVRRALARDRSLRYASARDMERDLSAFARAAAIDDSALAVADYLARLFPAADDGPHLHDLARGTMPPGFDEPSIAIIRDAATALHATRVVTPEPATGLHATRVVAPDPSTAILPARLQVAEAATVLLATPFAAGDATTALLAPRAGASASRSPRRRSIALALAGLAAVLGGGLLARPDHASATAARAAPAAKRIAAETPASRPLVSHTSTTPSLPIVTALEPQEGAATGAPDRAAATVAQPEVARSPATQLESSSAAKVRPRRSTPRAGTGRASTPPPRKAAWDPDSALLPGL
jgi:hypothetical protein